MYVVFWITYWREDYTTVLVTGNFVSHNQCTYQVGFSLVFVDSGFSQSREKFVGGGFHPTARVFVVDDDVRRGRRGRHDVSGEQVNYVFEMRGIRRLAMKH